MPSPVALAYAATPKRSIPHTITPPAFWLGHKWEKRNSIILVRPIDTPGQGFFFCLLCGFPPALVVILCVPVCSCFLLLPPLAPLPFLPQLNQTHTQSIQSSP